MFTKDERCDDCYGTGKRLYFNSYTDFTANDEGTEDICVSCYGTGRHLTEIGRELIDFLGEHFELHLKER